ncbi:AAA family ATPase [Leucobacter sp. gxy201]|uniref:AAA family ATPase n=1 Tax=Leucobacter sp. gxy201 TaxID=2957200 RepID=UPI003DA14358
MTFEKQFDEALKARLPLVALETGEEVRALEAIVAGAAAQRNPRQVWVWSSSTGLVGPDGKAVPNTAASGRALEHAAGVAEHGVFVFCDLQPYLGSETRPGDPTIVRQTRETAMDFRHGEASRMLVLVSPANSIPPELDEVAHAFRFPLPAAAEIRELLDLMIDNNSSGRGRIDTGSADDGVREQLVNAALGLSMAEAENAFARAMVNDGALGPDDVKVILDEKSQVVRRSGLLDFVDAGIDLDDVGGLDNLKRWLSRREGSWLDGARAYGLPAPKGVLITGVPGCGKSLTAKATAASWGLPLLRLDIGRVFSGLVGSSEQNLRNAIAVAEAVAPSVLWVDEIEKGFSNVTGQGDSGTSARVFGTFLTWLQEKQKPVFVVATANTIASLPPEFLRKGRFDEIFFVDLPTATERDAIWRIQLRSHASPANGLAAIAETDSAIARLVAESDELSGAEIEQAVAAALYDGFGSGRPVELDGLLHAIATMVPLSVTQAEEIARLRDWAEKRAVGATGSEHLDASTAVAAAVDAAGERIAGRRGGRTVDY